jgi:hypothetical protein
VNFFDRDYLEDVWRHLLDIDGLTQDQREGILRREARKLRSPTDSEVEDFIRQKRRLAFGTF